jgi:hypothetical protein
MSARVYVSSRADDGESVSQAGWNGRSCGLAVCGGNATARGSHRDRNRDVHRDRRGDQFDRARDAGRVSVFLAIGLFAVFMIIGLSVDGAGQLFAMQRAHNIAAEAARAGGQAIDEGQAIDGGRKVLDPVAAPAAAKAYRNAAGGTGAEPVIDLDGQAISVDVDLTYEPIMLSFFGWGNEIVVHGTAKAQLLDAPAP